MVDRQLVHRPRLLPLQRAWVRLGLVGPQRRRVSRALRLGIRRPVHLHRARTPCDCRDDLRRRGATRVGPCGRAARVAGCVCDSGAGEARAPKALKALKALELPSPAAAAAPPARTSRLWKGLDGSKSIANDRARHRLICVGISPDHAPASRFVRVRALRFALPSLSAQCVSALSSLV